MKYPNANEIEVAGREQLGRWNRFLPSPGTGAMDDPNFRIIMEEEGKKLERIMERFSELGGWTSDLSKKIGW